MTQAAIDPTFYRSAAEAGAAPAEKLAYVVAFDPAGEQHDALTVIDVDPDAATYGKLVGWSDVTRLGDELHHFGWNAYSSALMREGHDMAGLARRYLIVPGLRSSRLYIFDTHPDPSKPVLVKPSRQRSYRRRLATRGRTRCTVDPTASS